MKTFNHLRLNSLIAGSGMTQNEVAEKMGLHYNTISAWVNSKAPRPVQLIQVLRVVGMSEEALQEQRLLDWYQEAES